MKNKLTICLIAFLAVFTFVAAQAMAQVTVWGEGAYTDADVQINIYANIPPADALRSFGVRLVYDPTELTFDTSKSEKNETAWYLGDGTPAGNEHYMDPTDTDIGSGQHAVITIGGILDTGDTAKKVSGDRTLLATIWFTRPAGASGPLSTAPTLALGKPDPFKNFVVDTSTDLDGSVTFNAVDVFERGDANGDGYITNSDYFAVRQLIQNNIYKPYADCNNDGYVTNSDYFCIRSKL